MTSYSKANQKFYPGRSSESQLYLREVIQFATPDELQYLQKESFAIFGYSCDEGVRRNQGRVGAKDGPNAIRAQLGKLANHIQNPIVDFGNLICEDQHLEEYQKEFSKIVGQFIEQRQFPILLGGGHDIAFAHYQGIRNVYPQKSIGIINFDAHLDLRKPAPDANSGTPFFQIAQNVGKDNFHYLPIGIRAESNHRGLFQTAGELGVEMIPFYDCQIQEIENVSAKILSFAETVDLLYITIDLDGFSSAFAPGVSAPYPIGFSPQFVLACLRKLFQTGKVISIDIAELNPKHDTDHLTAKLGACLLYNSILFWSIVDDV